MKRYTARDAMLVSVVIITVLFGTLCWLCAPSDAAQEEKRWDIRTTADLPKWKALLQEPYLEGKSLKEKWPKKKEALEALLAKYPNSDYADDVAVAIACGTAACENNSQDADRLLTRVIEQCAERKSLMGRWQPGQFYCLDHRWYQWARDAAKGAQQRAWDGGSRSRPSRSKQATLAYFSHLEQYPNSTRDVATYYRIIIRLSRNPVQAQKELEKFAAVTLEQLVEINKADRQASRAVDGAFLKGVERPAVWACHDLVMSLRTQGKLDQAIGIAEKFVTSVSTDGYYWWMNDLLGDMYHQRDGKSRSPAAEKQYRLALGGYSERAKATSTLGDNRYLYSGAHSRPIIRLKKKINSAGGSIELNADEVKSWTGKAVRDAVSANGKELAQAVRDNDIAKLKGYASAKASRRVREEALKALAKTQEGRAELVKMLNEKKIDRFTAETVLAALSNTKAPDAIEHLRQYAQSVENPRLFAAAMEGVIKSMPKDEGLRLCLEEAEKLAENPDAAVGKLMFFIKGLRQDDDPPQVKVLRKILRKTKNQELRVACLRLLAKWVLDGCEARDDILRTLKAHLMDQHWRVRTSVVRALGQSGDVRCVRLLLPLLDDKDHRVQQASSKAICRLLGWQKPRLDTPEAVRQWTDQLKARLAPVLKALDDLTAATQEPTRK